MGIGEAIALAFASEGANLILFARSQVQTFNSSACSRAEV